ncbi:CBS domain-containing protein [Rubrivirga sp. IMCC43871]|uniref:CBS domain-containing protein n=1 Tax=Rubrivirga sp. IMCC43871 TaxID=3391575 RepID=UPI00398FB8B5
MTVATLLSAIEPLQTTDTVADALMDLADAHVAHLPVLDPTGVLDSIVTEAALREHPDPTSPLGALVAGEPVSIRPDTHVFDAAHLLRQHGLSVLPVLEESGEYAGLVVRQDVFGQLAHMLATEEPGAIVVLDMARTDFSLGQVVQLIEQNGVRILSVSTEDDPGASRVRVTLKLNVSDTARVRHLMDHYDYRVVAVFDEAEDDLEERAAAFLRYLNV